MCSFPGLHPGRGHIRSLRFKASLCLALGMADVVQSHVGGIQLDTMFIDEGFGSLDPVAIADADLNITLAAARVHIRTAASTTGARASSACRGSAPSSGSVRMVGPAARSRRPAL